MARAKRENTVEVHKGSSATLLWVLWEERNLRIFEDKKRCKEELIESIMIKLLVCLRVLIRRCAYENVNKDEIQKLFPPEVSPELQRLLILLLQKFQREWRDDALKDQVTIPRLKAMTWNMANQDIELTDPVAVINLKLQDDTQSLQGESDVKFQLTKDTLETMLRSMYYIRDQLSGMEENSNGHLQAHETSTV
ncbi:PREDICTED: uncharacterized protein LOC104592897 isoform X2 [Nelumbo nucifera]|uniref:Uncharacterized protein LOC104592897 isoform X2 n=2 Tax=Nelumbo nucifera TaxID=4432 RepID=A0A1U7ZRB7_NELNU|nr:PREDICTED: uncharacterized protein LOC104592897 isoform X2 [Nelumbo nucifera]XP_010250737.1 PREDICTED: uncharacterized protein LOC104592897 isoform X2 [Nelumbo nucifera]DAD34260.1 TPA_asm: hypothetical protein HUJ06_004900 [Nelumbo nucifera]